jgi:oxygen-dependent protoporphyrinogen oxidase
MMGVDKGSKRIVVVGAGIAGLAAAYDLARARQAGAAISELLIEAGRRVGGSIYTERREGFTVEAGPDSLLAEKPDAAALCRELGVGNNLIGSDDGSRRTYILHRGKLVPLPDGLRLFVPTQVASALATPLLPLSDKWRIVRELFRTPSELVTADEPVATFVRRHFGEAMLANIVDPLLAGVFGGDSGRLSARSVLPRFLEVERKHGSLIRGLVAEMPHPGPRPNQDGQAQSRSIFLSLRDGLGELTEGLAQQLEPQRVHFEERALDLAVQPGTYRYCVRCAKQSYDADAVILAAPAYECGRLIASQDGELSSELRAIRYSSAMTVALAYTNVSVPPGFGFLVPRNAGSRLLACTFVHQKFPFRAPSGSALLRCFLGGIHDPEVLELDDDGVTALVRTELLKILKIAAEPRFVRISRWPKSMPQYEVGHAERLERIRARLSHHPGLFLAGNAYSGIGISDSIRTGRAAASLAMSTQV